MLKRHLAHTGSAVAAQLLEDWEAAKRKFVKVIPHAFKRALEQMKNIKEKEEVAAAD